MLLSLSGGHSSSSNIIHLFKLCSVVVVEDILVAEDTLLVVEDTLLVVEDTQLVAVDTPRSTPQALQSFVNPNSNNSCSKYCWYYITDNYNNSSSRCSGVSLE